MFQGLMSMSTLKFLVFNIWYVIFFFHFRVVAEVFYDTFIHPLRLFLNQSLTNDVVPT